MLSSHESQLGNIAEAKMKMEAERVMLDAFTTVRERDGYSAAVGYVQGIHAAIKILTDAAKEINGASDRPAEGLDVRKRYED